MYDLAIIQLKTLNYKSAYKGLFIVVNDQPNF